MRLAAGIVGLGFCAAWLGAADTARACSFACETPVLLFGPDAHVPPNHVYFPLTAPDDPGELVLRTAADKKPIRASIQIVNSMRVFAPDEPVPANTRLELVYADCGDERIPGNIYRFTTTNPVDVESKPIELKVVERGVSSASEAKQTSFVTVVDASDNDLDLRHVTYYRAVIDGDYAAMDGNRLRITTDCSADAAEVGLNSCGTGLVAPGKHSLEVTRTILGQDSTVAQLELETSCPQLCEDGSIGGKQVPVEGAASQSVIDTEAQEAGAQGDSSGCSVGAGPVSYGAWMLIPWLASARLRRRKNAQ